MEKTAIMENMILDKEPEQGKSLRLGVIGCGKMTMAGHIYSFDKLKNAKITALCDIRIEAAKAVADQCAACRDAFITADYKEMLPYVDAVLVVLPHAEHYPCGKFFLENGWNCQTAAGEKAAWAIDYSDVKLIYIEPYRTYFKKDFWQTKIAPAVNNGATLVFRSYHWLGMLGKDFGDKTYAVTSKENSHKIRKPTFIDPEFAKSGHDLNRFYKSCGTLTFTPKHPEKWTVLMTQLTKDNKQGASVLARRFGKGKIFIIAQIRGTIGIIENMVNYTPPEK